MKRETAILDGNQAAAHVAYKVSDVIAIYPITPSSPMGEWADQWMADGTPNAWGTVPIVSELQSEGGASGAIHGALQAGALATTFTASQGLLLMIPNMYKIAGELTPGVFHIAARAVATNSLSIFGDHTDVMATRSTGWAMLFSNSIQEVMDQALIAHSATLKCRLPFIHAFDGFRTSHELQKVEALTNEDCLSMMDDELIKAHRERALCPDHPVLRGTAQNPDVFFQGRETVNAFYDACPDLVQETMDEFAKLTGRQYKLFDYHGAPDAERVIVLMGSGAETADEAVDYMVEKGEKVGVLKVRLYRPFSIKHFLGALPKTVKAIAALDRTKEPGATGEPLYQDMVTAFAEDAASDSPIFASVPAIVGGRYGLGSKEFTPAMVAGVFDTLTAKKPKNHFTVGIIDDLTNTSLPWDPEFHTERPDVVRALFYGLGADGTVGANKNSIKIIGEETDNNIQGYFVYDSKKSGSMTVSHLRFGPRKIKSTYLINSASFVACHQWPFVEKIDMLKGAAKGATFLLNSIHSADDVWNHLPRELQKQIIDKQLKFYVIDAYSVARDAGMGQRINTIMQTCFFAISGILPREEAIAKIKQAIDKTYGRKSKQIVELNWKAVDMTLANLHEVKVPSEVSSSFGRPPMISEKAPKFLREVTAEIMAGRGDDLKTGDLPNDGTWPIGSARWEKRNIALEIPVWDPDVCIQCGKCAMVCPHAAIQTKACDPKALEGAPESFKSTSGKGKEFKDMAFTIQVAPEDCTGCAACVYVCPAFDRSNPKHKAINMAAQEPLREQEAANWEFFTNLPEPDRTELRLDTVKGAQMLDPLFEFSGACPGCGETPYVKLVSQLFGDRMLVANATGCSSIYGGNLPTTPWGANKDGRGPAWSNSLFEDNAEFGFGFSLTVEKLAEYARELVLKLSTTVGDELAKELVGADMKDEKGIREQRARVEILKKQLEGDKSPDAQRLLTIADYLVRKSIWIMGGDGWAYDIGFGGLDHVLASGRNVNVLVLDTEVYSNTGGQASKATPRGAVAKFAMSGKPQAKKDLGLIAMSYGNVYVARVAYGASDVQTVRAILEAEAYEGPSLILAYSHCIAHGINMRTATDLHKDAVNAGHWPLMRYNPDNVLQGQNPLKLESKAPKISYRDFADKQTRFKMLMNAAPEQADKLMKLAQEDARSRWELYEQMAGLTYSAPGSSDNGGNGSDN
ncbi:pyruvate:ferredoxin (flavodoxin) oxidoreductase [bacterium]|nr:pyruvate:ferredoxin (flavodoxin) oxidoreductase [bacterium]